MSKEKPVKKITSQYLERAAMYYLARFSSSSENLRRILERKVWRRVNLGADKPCETENWLNETINKCQRMGLVDDAQYALVRAKNFHKKGRGLSVIRAELKHKGIAEEIIEKTIVAINPDGEADFNAALYLARKKKLGNFASKQPQDAEEAKKINHKHLGVLARAGFSFQIAKEVLKFKI
jgi:regulatory protein